MQALGTGFGAWVGGLLLSTDAAGHVLGYGTNGWLSVSISTLALVWIGRVTSAPAAREPVRDVTDTFAPNTPPKLASEG